MNTPLDAAAELTRARTRVQAQICALDRCGVSVPTADFDVLEAQLRDARKKEDKAWAQLGRCCNGSALTVAA